MIVRKSRDPYEHYVTPAWTVHRLLEHVCLYSWRNAQWLDPCCGTGALGKAVSECVPDAQLSQLDIRGGTVADGRADYLALDAQEQSFDVCIMNPPFSRAMEFARQARRHCGVVIMLQRLNWLASAERNDWLRKNAPSVYVLPNRPDFTGDGGDRHDYAWFVWGLGYRDVRPLAATPASVRKAQKPRRAA